MPRLFASDFPPRAAHNELLPPRWQVMTRKCSPLSPTAGSVAPPTSIAKSRSRRERDLAMDVGGATEPAVGDSGLHLRVITCHLGGSNSLCAARGGKSLANSLGMSPQTGLPHNNRVGDFDPFALPALMRATGKTLEQLLDDLANQSGLMGLSCISSDLWEIELEVRDGNPRAKLTLDVFVGAV